MTAPYNVTAETVQGVVQGENNTVTLTINNYSTDGSVVTPSKRPAPGPRALSTPVRLLPRAFPDLLGRGNEVEAAVVALRSQRPLEVFGAAGIGKSALLRHLAHHSCTEQFVSGVVFREYRNEPVADLVQKLFEAFYDSDVKFTDTRIRSYLQDTQALVIVDDAELGREQLETLGITMPSSILVLASQQPLLLGEGKHIALRGLADADALALLQRRLDRELDPGEYEAGVALSRAVDGNPLRITQAAALLLQDRDLRLDDLLARVGTGATGVDAVVLSAATSEERAVLGALAPFRDTPVDALHLERMAGIPAAAAVLASLEDRGLVRSNSPRYSVVGPVRDIVIGDGVPASETTRMLRYFSAMVKETRALKPGGQDVDVVLAAAHIAAADERWPEVLTLARSLDGALALERRWGAWESMLRLALRASEATHDLSGQGWARHQLGTRALCLEDYHEAGTELRRALQLREVVGDSAGLAATRANLDVLEMLHPRGEIRRETEIQETNGPLNPWPRLLWAVAAAVLVVAVVVVAARALSGDGGGEAVSVTSVTPSELVQGARGVPLAVAGDGFDEAARVTLSGAGASVVSVGHDSEQRLTVVVSVDPDAGPGPRDVSVANPDGGAGSCRACFAVTAASAPVTVPTTTRLVVSSLEPSVVAAGARAARLVLNGEGFLPGADVSFSGGDIQVEDVRRVSVRQLDLVVTVETTAEPGDRDVRVTNPGGSTATCRRCLTVEPGPTVTSVRPAEVSEGERNVALTVVGSGFAGTPTLTVEGKGVTVTSVSSSSATLLRAVISVDGDAGPGTRDVSVTNPDGSTGSCAGCLTIVGGPKVTSVKPATVLQGSRRTLAVLGTGFVAPPSVDMGAGIEVLRVLRSSATTLAVEVAVRNEARTGARSVTVTNPDGGTFTCRGCLTVTAPDVVVATTTTLFPPPG
ncbi:MAG TPA: hypothetical protein VNA57_11010 [Acidimicrobiales bacterium]|nr:hypothetical protein [Acidimicrobiales bacterium]